MVILDTDHMSVLERREQPGVGNLLARLAELPPLEVVTTVISYEEQMRGWIAFLARAQSMAHQITAYGRLLSHLDNYRRIPVLGFDEAAATVFQRLRRARIRIGTMDLKIASIVLSHDATLRAIAQELVRTVRANVTIDWTLRENVRAQLRVLVKRILRKHGYPPDKQEQATHTVLEQAEVLSAAWAAA